MIISVICREISQILHSTRKLESNQKRFETIFSFIPTKIRKIFLFVKWTNGRQCKNVI